MTKAVPRLCRMCPNIITGQGKHYCGHVCAAKGRVQKREETEYARQIKEWPEIMFLTRPFERHEHDPGDGEVRRLPGPEANRFGGGASSAAYAEQFGSLKPY